MPKITSSWRDSLEESERIAREERDRCRELYQHWEDTLARLEAIKRGSGTGDPTRYQGLEILPATKLALKERKQGMTAEEIVIELLAGGIEKSRHKILLSLPQQIRAGKLKYVDREKEIIGLP